MGNARLRIGEYLVEREIISRDELELALHRQLIYGGRIGTNLVRLGLISEDVLISLLQVVNNAKGINIRKIEPLSRSTIAMLDCDTVVKYKCVPFEVSSTKLKIACIDILNDTQVQALEKKTGKSIIQYVFPEIQWIDAMQEYYDYDATAMEDILKQRDKTPEIKEDEEEKISRVIPIVKDSEFEQDELEDLLGEINPDLQSKSDTAFSDLNEIENLLQSDSGLLTEGNVPQEVMIDEELLEALLNGDEDDFSEYKERTGWKRPRVVEPDDESGVERISLAEATIMLSRAINREQVAITLLTMAANYFDDAIIFLVKHEMINGWLGIGKNIKKENLEEFEFSLLNDSFLLDHFKSSKSYHGPIVISNNNRHIIKQLDLPWPTSVSLIPIVVRNRIVAVLYLATYGRSVPLNDKVNIEILAKKASIAFEILILKMKDKGSKENKKG
ncbi:MAG: hypothetical protein JW737_08695 [Acidobacteria bacterium]|nr:hypothetical protein [Acidobacteriota bacterium]